jgi:very-short-patch-repair endonuclease
MSTLAEIVSSQSTHRKLSLRQRARFMRHNLTASERALWVHIKSKQLGVSFRRQVVVGHFVVDFLASSVRLIVEVDGSYHTERVQLDAKRQARLERAGYHIVRVSHELVIQQPAVAVERVRVALEQCR